MPLKIKILQRNFLPLTVTLVTALLFGSCTSKEEPVTKAPLPQPVQTDTMPKAEPPEKAPAYKGQPLVFVAADEATLYAQPSDTSTVRMRLTRDALLVLIEKGEHFYKVHAPVFGVVGYVKDGEVTSSIQTLALSQSSSNELAKEARVKLIKEFEHFPSIEALEHLYLYPFITTDDMLKMVSQYKGDIGSYPFYGQPVSWELNRDSLPRAIARKLKNDSLLTASLFKAGSKVVLLAGEPFFATHEEYDENGVLKPKADPAVRIIKSRLFEESLRLIRLTRETGKGSIIVSHGPPHHQCHQSEFPVSFFGVGKFIHTCEKRLPVKLLLKNGCAEGYITRIEHSTYEVSPCYSDGGKGMFFIETTVPETEKIYGVLALQSGSVTPAVTVAKSGDWTADLNGDGIPDLKCLFKKNPEYEELLTAFYFININGTWVLTDKRHEPECT